LEIPSKYLRVAIGRTKDITGNTITKEDVQKLEKNSRPTLLLSIDQPENDLPPKVRAYLRKGVELGLPERPLIKQRHPWFKMEKREVPELLFAYLGRRNTRFIKNVAGVLPLTGFLCVYTKGKDDKFVDSLWNILNHPDTLKNLQFVGKSYGAGAIKVEPRSLENLPIPEYIVDKYNLKKSYEYHEDQLGFIYEKRRKYRSRRCVKE
jgi:adenine-specific DNA-methyltransferase